MGNCAFPATSDILNQNEEKAPFTFLVSTNEQFPSFQTEPNVWKRTPKSHLHQRTLL